MNAEFTREQELLAQAAEKAFDRNRELGIQYQFPRSKLLSPDFGLNWDQLKRRTCQSIRIIGWACKNVINGYSREAFKALVATRTVTGILGA